MKHNLSTNLYSLRFLSVSYADKVKKTREIGYQSIQSGLPPDDMGLKNYKTLIDDLGIEICTFSGPLLSIPSSPKDLIDACHLFNCDEVMIGALPEEYREDYDSYMKGIDLFNTAARVLIKEGIYLSFHNHAQEFRKFNNGKRAIDLMFENFDPKASRFLLDTHWIQSGGGDIFQWMEKCKGRMKFLHVKDYRIAPANYNTNIGTVDKQFTQIGDGQLPWDLIIKKGLEVGIEAFIVEQDFTYDDEPFDCMAQSFAKLKSLGLN